MKEFIMEFNKESEQFVLEYNGLVLFGMKNLRKAIWNR